MASVQACDNRGSDFIQKMWFFDKNNRKIDSYNPRLLKFDGALFEIEEGAEIIGVYGVMGKRDYLTSLGFLVKKENV